MNRQSNSALFAFKVAQKQQAAKPAAQWKVRDGVAVAGCTGAEFRAPIFHGAPDSGLAC